jgi:hypothetical protein
MSVQPRSLPLKLLGSADVAATKTDALIFEADRIYTHSMIMLMNMSKQ